MTQPQHIPLRSPRQLAILCTIILVIGSISACQSPAVSTPTPTLPPPPSLTPTSSLSPTDPPTQTPYVITATPAGATPIPAAQGMFFMSLADSGHTHLFAYSPQALSLTRITFGDYDDIAPCLSPDGTKLAFASNRNGYWNIYILDLSSGEASRLTDSPAYKGHPSWSPDQAYIAYDSLLNGNLEILISSTSDNTQAPINLTQSSYSDFSPAWSPQGRQIAFVSNRSGEPEIWLVSLDSPGNAVDLSQDIHHVESHPAWSPDGSLLAWAAHDQDSGLNGIYVWDTRSPSSPARWVASGDWPAWQDASHIASLLTSPNQYFLTAFSTSGTLSLPPVLMPASVDGLAYGTTALSLPGPFGSAASLTPAPLYGSLPATQPGALPGRYSVVSLDGVQAPYPQMHELAVDPFQALRSRVASLTGWDALASLENAYIPLTTSLDPGLGEDWLYTGRAFSLNPALMQAGWMEIVREDFGQQTYWRIFLRTTAQDGSAGAPLTQAPWDFSARTGDASAYENGGKLMVSIPPGYWVDLTSLALQFGWERLPALTNWRTYYAGARFNELAFSQGLDWRTAMLQLYPADVLVTPTVVIPPTRTPTRLPPFYRSPTPTSTPTPLPTSTP